MATKQELLRIASRLSCKYQDRCEGHTMAGHCPTCWARHNERKCILETKCPPCEAAQALRILANARI
jgi:hypothetical protein